MQGFSIGLLLLRDNVVVDCYEKMSPKTYALRFEGDNQ